MGQIEQKMNPDATVREETGFWLRASSSRLILFS
jgi:hypothetical protein